MTCCLGVISVTELSSFTVLWFYIVTCEYAPDAGRLMIEVCGDDFTARNKAYETVNTVQSLKAFVFHGSLYYAIFTDF